VILEPLAHDEVLLLCGPQHPWAQRESVSLAEVVAEPQVVQQQGAGLRSVVEDRLLEAGVPPQSLNVVLEMGLMESAKQACIAGGGVTFLSRWAVGPELEHGTLAQVRVDGFEIRRDFCTVRSRTRVLSRAAEALLAYFREQYAAAG
jgi:DNA-binding transcriptional LysR family regulator